MSWFIVSKAFCKSMRIIPVSRPESKPVNILFVKYESEVGPVWKMVNTWPKKNLCYPVSKIGVFDFLLSGIFGKKNKEIKKVDFWSILAFFVSSSMLI